MQVRLPRIHTVTVSLVTMMEVRGQKKRYGLVWKHISARTSAVKVV